MSPADTGTVRALVDSLFENPFYQAVTADCENDLPQRKRMLSSYFEYSLHEAQRAGRLVVGPAAEAGAALWQLPRSATQTAAESAAKNAFMMQLFGPRGIDNYQRILEFMEPRVQSLVPPEAWYLSILGVQPQLQGRGVGARLLAPTMAESKAAGAICYLETFGSRGIPFYQRQGFHLIGSHVEPTTGAEYHIMRTVP